MIKRHDCTDARNISRLARCNRSALGCKIPHRKSGTKALVSRAECLSMTYGYRFRTWTCAATQRLSSMRSPGCAAEGWGLVQLHGEGFAVVPASIILCLEREQRYGSVGLRLASRVLNLACLGIHTLPWSAVRCSYSRRASAAPRRDPDNMRDPDYHHASCLSGTSVPRQSL